LLVGNDCFKLVLLDAGGRFQDCEEEIPNYADVQATAQIHFAGSPVFDEAKRLILKTFSPTFF